MTLLRIYRFMTVIALILVSCWPISAQKRQATAIFKGAKKLIPLNASVLTDRGAAKNITDGDGVRLIINDPYGGSALEVTPGRGRRSWDMSEWEVLAVDVKNLTSQRQQRLVMTVTAEGDGGKMREVTTGIAINPGETRTMRLLLPHRWEFAAPPGIPGVRTIDTAHVLKLSFALQWPFEKATKGLLDCKLTNLRLEHKLRITEMRTNLSYTPFIDQFGQFVHAEWPRKIHTASELRARYAQETREFARVQRPSSWDRYGGWKDGPLLKATGSFRTDKYKGKWYFVDPEGRLFFSQGMDVLSARGEPLKVPQGKEGWFEALPPGSKEYNAVEHNLREKYGRKDFYHEYYQRLATRLESWGFNTIGDWSSPELMSLGRTPYTLQLTDYDDKMPRIKGSKLKFYDVFDPVYIHKMKTLIPDQAAKNPIVLRSLTDPMCIGYFIDNELNFGDRGNMVLVDEILQSPPTQASKKQFVSDLKLKYVTVEKLNAAWHTSYSDWSALLTSTAVPRSSGYRVDANMFFEKILEQYFRLARNAVKAVAPNRLYLGARFISTDAVRPALYDMCFKYCDVLSVNIYADSAANFPSNNFPDMPVLITEFQFGILERGMFSASLCPAGVSPDDRALAYTRFLQGVLTNPNFVGAQWFQYRDQPLTGRGDGEAYQIGFVDVTDTPYSEMTHASRMIGKYMYSYRFAGKLTNSMAPTRTEQP